MVSPAAHRPHGRHHVAPVRAARNGRAGKSFASGAIGRPAGRGPAVGLRFIRPQL